MRRNSNGHNPAFGNSYHREYRTHKINHRPQIFLEGVMGKDGRRGYFHCHILVDGMRTDIRATYVPDEDAVYIEPLHKVNGIPYFISQQTTRRQKKLRGNIRFQLARSDYADLAETNTETSYVFHIPVKYEIELDFRRKNKIKKRKKSLEEDSGENIFTIRLSPNTGLGKMLADIGKAKALEVR